MNLLMWLAMLGAMLFRWRDYAQHHHGQRRSRHATHLGAEAIGQGNPVPANERLQVALSVGVAAAPVGAFLHGTRRNSHVMFVIQRRMPDVSTADLAHAPGGAHLCLRPVHLTR